jgi:peptidyl-prolyl cis-trans isomerase SurA
VNAAIKTEDLLRYVDTVMLDPDASYAYKESPISKKALITFSKGNVKGEDWLNYARDYKLNGEIYKGESNEQIWEKYKIAASIDYYRKHLEDYSAEFRYQLQEFKEGNLLFEIMERNVWSKASADTAGLRAYYEANAAQYKWAASADVLILNAVSEQLAKLAQDSLKAGKKWQDLIDINQGELQGDSARFEIAQIGGDENAPAGSFSSVVRNADGTATFIQYFRHYPAGQQRSFEDARGMVINDYQNVLEKKWLAALKKKYPVRVNEVILKQIIKEIK